MESKTILGYVKTKQTGDILPYVYKDENGYEILHNIEGTSWWNANYFIEVDGTEENQFIKNVHDLIDRQQEKGLKKYGTLVNKDDYSMLGWIEHAQQELADGLIYLEMIKAKVKDVIG